MDPDWWFDMIAKYTSVDLSECDKSFARRYLFHTGKPYVLFDYAIVNYPILGTSERRWSSLPPHVMSRNVLDCTMALSSVIAA